MSFSYQDMDFFLIPNLLKDKLYLGLTHYIVKAGLDTLVFLILSSLPLNAGMAGRAGGQTQDFLCLLGKHSVN